MDKDKIIKFTSYCLCVVGIICVIDTFLVQFFSIGSYSKELSLGYCIAFIITTTIGTIMDIMGISITIITTIIIPLTII